MMTDRKPSAGRRIFGILCIILGVLAMLLLSVGYYILSGVGCAMALSEQARIACNNQPTDWALVASEIGIPMLLAAGLVWLGVWIKRPET
jgi:hypothetical protein